MTEQDKEPSPVFISKEIEIEVSYTFWDGLVWHIRNLLELIASGFKWLLGLIGINL